MRRALGVPYRGAPPARRARTPRPPARRRGALAPRWAPVQVGTEFDAGFGENAAQRRGSQIATAPGLAWWHDAPLGAAEEAAAGPPPPPDPLTQRADALLLERQRAQSAGSLESSQGRQQHATRRVEASAPRGGRAKGAQHARMERLGIVGSSLNERPALS